MGFSAIFDPELEFIPTFPSKPGSPGDIRAEKGSIVLSMWTLRIAESLLVSCHLCAYPCNLNVLKWGAFAVRIPMVPEKLDSFQ